MKVPPTARTAEVGVAIVQLAVQDELGWLFREQPVCDYGVDAHVEVVEGGRTGGRLLAVQIKSGASYLRERVGDGFVFRPSPDHVEYWLSHSLPVVVVLVDTTERTAWWQSVTPTGVPCVTLARQPTHIRRSPSASDPSGNGISDRVDVEAPGHYSSRSVASRRPKPPDFVHLIRLPPDTLDVLVLLARGQSERAIAEEMSRVSLNRRDRSYVRQIKRTARGVLIAAGHERQRR